MNLFANLIYPIITLILFLLNTYFIFFLFEKPWGIRFAWWIISSVILFFIMGLIRLYNDNQKEKETNNDISRN